eukprot:GSChrysophyteH1.ASY1.ANO1.2084.1 assembled CDS
MKEDKAAYNRTDTTSLSNCQDAVSEHIHIVWTIDYRKQKLVGTATHTIKVLKSGTAFVSFDSSDLNVTNATVDGKDVEVVADKKHAALGTKLTVPLPESRRNAGHTVTVSFTYATSPTASAIQWAEAAATADKKYPYVYTQCQAIHARSLLPCQDSPGVKTTYTAEVTAPEWCTVLMSAVWKNPCLTFVTPTLLTGDKSLADVIMHEIAHSWTGNLVTNQTWNHFFLNEGWTMWLQRKIEKRVKGGEDYFKLNNPLTCLVCPLGDQDPDDSFSSVPYEKGFTMLYHLETLIGSSNFERFAKHYIDTFKFKTVTSGTFKDCFIKWCNDQKLPQGIMKAVKEIDWDDLFHSPDASKSLAESWIQAGWNTQQKLIFLDELLEYNAEIRFKWQNLCIKSEVAWILPSAKELLLSQGRMKFTRPLYRLLAASKMGATLAHETFAQNSSIYHPICRKMVKSDLEKAAGRRGWVGATLGPVKLTPNMFTNVAATLGMFLLGQLK